MQFEWVATALKRALKAKQVTYRELARELEMTESGVKKLFAGTDCSLGRLTEICRVAGVTLADILEAGDGRDEEDVAFSGPQQAYFLAHPDYFRFFWKLAFERRTVAEIARAEAFTPAETARYLKKLEELGLVERHAGDRLRLPRLKRVRSFGDGPLVRKVYRDWSIQFMREAARPDPAPDRLFTFRYLRMKKDTYAELLAEIKRVESEFLKRAIREMSVDPRHLIDARWVSAIDSDTFVRKVRE